MAKKASAADAEVILKLYDLRREPELRKARNWWLITFWPLTADDYLKISNALGTQENAWLRQVNGYWDMAAALVLHGAVNVDLFVEGGVSGEMFFFFAKVQPILKELRAKMQSPGFMRNVETVVMATKAGRERLKMVSGRVNARLKAIAEGK